jgi:hypothetical protein
LIFYVDSQEYKGERSFHMSTVSKERLSGDIRKDRRKTRKTKPTE